MRERFIRKGLAGGLTGAVLLLLATASVSPFFLLSVAHAFDAAAGEKVFLKCRVCHTANKGGANLIGPNLWGVVGRKAGTLEGFSYSEAMKTFGKRWDAALLDAYLKKPSAVVAGGRMIFAGLSDAKQRADVIAYLNSKSDKPIRLKAIKRSGGGEKAKAAKAVKETGETGSAKGMSAANEVSLLPAGVGRFETEAYCSPCHSLRLVVQQGLSRDDWDELLDWMVEEQAMEPIEAGDRKKILGYLTKYFNTDRANFK